MTVAVGPERPWYVKRRRFFGFVVTGGLAAGVNLLSRWLLSRVLVYTAAVALAYLAGMATAYVLARAFVFEPSHGRWQGEFMRFATVNLVSFPVVLAVSVVFDWWLLPVMGWTWHREEVAHLVGVSSPIVLSYYAHKHFSFVPRGAEA